MHDDLAGHDRCGLGQLLVELGDRSPGAAWTLSAALVPAKELLGEFAAPDERWVPVLMDHVTHQVCVGDGGDSIRSTAHQLAHVLVRLGAAMRRRPSRLEVSDPALAAELRTLLEPSGILVNHVASGSEDPPLELVRQALDSESDRTAGTPEIEAERLAMRSAHDLRAARPWRVLTRLDPIMVEIEGAPWPWPCVVLEAPEGGKGVTFLKSLDAAWKLGRGVVDAEEALDACFVEYIKTGLVSVSERYRSRRLEYPAPIDGTLAHVQFSDPTSASDPSPEVVRLRSTELSILLVALAQLDDAVVDGGRWTLQVPTPEGPRTVTMSWPDASAPPSLEEWRRRGQPIDERCDIARTVLLRRLRQRGLAHTPEAAAEILGRSRAAILAELESTAQTPREHAESLWARAVHTRGRARRRLAEQAIERSRDWPAAWVVLAEESTEFAECLGLLREAVAAGERAASTGRAVGSELDLAVQDGLKAQFDIAVQQHLAKQDDVAIVTLREVLLRSPDHAPARMLLATVLLQRGEHAEAAQVIASVPTKNQPLAAWIRVVAEYLLSGTSVATMAAVREAVRFGPLPVLAIIDPEYLNDPELQRPEFASARILADAVELELRPLIADRKAFHTTLREAMEAFADEVAARQPKRQFKQRKVRRR